MPDVVSDKMVQMLGTAEFLMAQHDPVRQMGSIMGGKPWCARCDMVVLCIWYRCAVEISDYFAAWM